MSKQLKLGNNSKASKNNKLQTSLTNKKSVMLKVKMFDQKCFKH